MRETEITVEVFDRLENINKILMDQGFEIIRQFNLNDLYYSKYSIEELKRMNYAEMLRNSLLVRDVIDDNPVSQIVFKDKMLDENDNVISEEKFICKIDNINNASKVFDMIGLTCWSDLRQKIYVYSKSNVEFAVQVIDDLGIFIEYEEDDTMKGLSENEKIAVMLNNLKNIGLNIGKDYSCKKVYLKFQKEYLVD